MPVEDDVTPPKKLALSYAPAELRLALKWLLLLDERLKSAVLGASEPMIAQLKLAWWRDAIGATPERRPKGEPLLQQLADIPKFDVIQPALALIDAWDLFVAEEREQGLAARGDALFATYANWLGAPNSDAITALGQAWAQLDMGQATQPVSTKGTPRPLSILYHAALLQAQPPRPLDGLRLLWHAFTGR